MDAECIRCLFFVSLFSLLLDLFSVAALRNCYAFSSLIVYYSRKPTTPQFWVSQNLNKPQIIGIEFQLAFSNCITRHLRHHRAVSNDRRGEERDQLEICPMQSAPILVFVWEEYSSLSSRWFHLVNIWNNSCVRLFTSSRRLWVIGFSLERTAQSKQPTQVEYESVAVFHYDHRIPRSACSLIRAADGPFFTHAITASIRELQWRIFSIRTDRPADDRNKTGVVDGWFTAFFFSFFVLDVQKRFQ